MTRVHDFVYTILMKNITFSAQEELIEQARKIAAQKNRTLNDLFREWLTDLNANATDNNIGNIKKLWKRTSYLHVGKKASREEMNER